jgi:hypothetical protein
MEASCCQNFSACSLSHAKHPAAWSATHFIVYCDKKKKTGPPSRTCCFFIFFRAIYIKMQRSPVHA